MDSKGVAYKDGTARISGTHSCTNADGYASNIEGTLTQTVGRVKINGFFFINPLECGGATHGWDAFVFSENGLFAGGKAANFSIEFACGLVECTVAEVSGKGPAEPQRQVVPPLQLDEQGWDRSRKRDRGAAPSADS